jgi:signal transduction histidine kinase
VANSRSVGAISARQALFFVLAIVVPCALLVVLTVRMLVQERELADQRIADERVRIAADVRQELLSHLERLRLEAAAAEPLPQVALVAQVDGGRLVMPWERDPAPGAAALALEQPTFREAVREGERQ